MMTKETDFSAIRIDIEGSCCCRSRDETVNDDWQTCLGCFQDGSCHRRDLKSADRLQPVKACRFSCERAIFVQRSANHLNLVSQRFISNSGTPTRNILRGNSTQRSDQSRGRGRIADSHLPDADQINLICESDSGLLAAGFNGPIAFWLTHRRFVQKIRGSLSNRAKEKFRILQQFLRPDRGHAGIDNMDIDLAVACQNVDRSSPAHEIQDHLSCDLARVSANILLAYAMAACVDADSFSSQAWRDRALQSSDAYREIFEYPK